MWYTSSYGKCMSFLMDFPYDGKGSKTHRMGKAWKIGPHTYELFSQLDSHPAVYFTIWEMHGFSLQFFIAQENNIVWGRFWEISTHAFAIVWAFFPIRFPSHGILRHLENGWVSPSIFHSTGKWSKIHQIARAWKIGTHTFPKVWVLSFH